MSEGRSDYRENLLSHVLLPVANPEDARSSAIALEPYQPDHVTGLHVVEKGDGVADKTPVEQSETLAAQSFSAIRDVFPDADDRTTYDRHVVEAIYEVADEIHASAKAHRRSLRDRLLGR